MATNNQPSIRLDSTFDNWPELLGQAQRSSDFTKLAIVSREQPLSMYYYKTLVDEKKLQQLLFLLQEREADQTLEQLQDMEGWLPLEKVPVTSRIQEIQSKLMKGYAILQLGEDVQAFALLEIPHPFSTRKDNTTENEFSVVGPKVGFVEDLDTNLHLLRSQISIPNLVVKELNLGTVSHTRVAILSIDGVTNDEHVKTVEQRLTNMDFEVIFDTAQLDQIISDNSLTPFPLFVSTERRDRVVYALISGQVAVISDGSPYFITGPSTLFDFFISPEDYYLPWILGSFFRMVRILGVFLSVFATSIYIAVATFHYEIIPMDLLEPFIASRHNVPFPPVLEVLFLEITIEFLREAGARLPTKIGQTLGIVGGVIIGQAAVQAALTSNILIIVVALSALASFTTPIYKMSNTIRFLRFPFILLAAGFGAIGIAVGCSMLLIHITRLRSLGNPYTMPLFPLYINDFKDSFIRSSYQLTNTRPRYLNPVTLLRYAPKSKKKQPKSD